MHEPPNLYFQALQKLTSVKAVKLLLTNRKVPVQKFLQRPFFLYTYIIKHYL